jgi:hypothetical protein
MAAATPREDRVREERVSVSAEIRWFWQNALPPGLETFFRSGAFPPGGGRPRSDDYLLDTSQIELGLKKRGGKDGVEIKGLVAVREVCPAPFEGRAQIWSKWISNALTIDQMPRLVVHKTRWLRKFDTSGADVTEVELDAEERPRQSPDRMLECGCHFELVAIQVDERAWWTVGFEAFGPLDTVEESLARTVKRLAPAPPVPPGLELSYPAWLARLRT